MSSDLQGSKAVIYNKDGSIREQVGAPTAAPKPKAPPPGMGARKAPPPAKPRAARPAETADDHAEDLAEALYEKFMGLLADSMEKNGGNLTTDDLDEFGAEFRANMGSIKKTFMDAVEAYALNRELDRKQQERKQVFQRIMIERFDNRLVDDKTLKKKPDHLSRRMLPGFNSMLAMMVGPAKMERFEKQSNALVDRLKKEGGGKVDWAKLHAAPDSRRIALIGQVEMAGYFKDAEKRLDWMVAMVNSNLIPADDHTAHEAWSFTREAAEALLCDLFTDLRATLKDATARAKFADQLGDEAVAVLDGVAKRFGG